MVINVVLPSKSSLMSFAACIPSSLRFFSICLLRALEALSSADIAHPMMKFGVHAVKAEDVVMELPQMGINVNKLYILLVSSSFNFASV